MPIRRGDGTSISPKGYQEVRMGDGTVLWSSDGQTGGGGGDTIPDTENLLARWDVSESSTADGAEYATIADQSGNGHDLSGGGATHDADAINGSPAAHFDGADDYLTGPPSDVIDLGSTSAVASVYVVWRSLDPSHFGSVITQTLDGPAEQQEFAITHNGGANTARVRLGGIQTDYPGSLDTEPHKVGALFDRGAGDATISWDGTTTSAPMGSVGDNDQPVRLGARGSGDDTGVADHLHGYISEVLVYGTQHDTPTHDDVMAYLDRWIPESEPEPEPISDAPDAQNLAAHWDFSQASASDGEAYATVADISGNGHDLTGQGATHITEGINGFPSAQFDGSGSLEGPPSDVLDVSSTSSTASIYVTWQSSATDYNGTILSQTLSGLKGDREFSEEFTATIDTHRYLIGGAENTSTTGIDTDPHATATMFDRGEGSVTVSYDGETTSGTAGGADAAGIPFRIGARSASDGASGYFQGMVGEVLVYDVEHDLATHDEIVNYLDRWIPEPEVPSDAPDVQNLQAHWDFSQVEASDGEAYETVADLSGSGNDLSGEGATHAADGINGLPAAYFDGTDDYLRGPGADVLDIGSNDVTKSVYLAWRSADASHTGYLMTQTGNGSRDLQEFSHIFFGSENQVDFSLGGTVTANADMMDTNPHTTAARIDRPAGTATLSWDGAAQGTTTGSEGDVNNPIRLGARGVGTSDVGTFYNGYIGEVLIYDGVHDSATHDAVMDHLSRWSE